MLFAVPLLLHLASAPSTASEASFAPPREIHARLNGWLEISAGRGLLVGQDSPHPVALRRGTVPLAGPGHLELAAGATASLRWAGVGSLRLIGPVSIAWRPGAGATELHVELGSLKHMDMEIRRGPIRVDLPDRWRLALNAGAFSFERLPGGGCELMHRAGDGGRVSWIGGADFALPPTWLAPGQSLRLQGGFETPAPTDPSSDAPSWGEPTWPWGKGPIHDVPDLPAGPLRAWQAERWPWSPSDAVPPSWSAWDWPWSAQALSEEVSEATRAPSAPETAADVVRDSLPVGRMNGVEILCEPIQLDEFSLFGSPWIAESDPAAAAESMEIPTAPPSPDRVPASQEQEVESTAAPLEIVTPTPQPASVLETTTSVEVEAPPSTPEVPGAATPTPKNSTSNSWRDLEESELDRRSNFALERSPHLAALPLAAGGYTIALSAAATEPAWYFVGHSDVQLFPGATLVVDEHGSILYHTGQVKYRSARRPR